MIYKGKGRALLSLGYANFSRRKRTSAMAVILTAIAVMTIVTAGSLQSEIKEGLSLSQQRMGADVVIYPKETKISDEELLFSGIPQMVYMEDSVIDNKLPEKDILNISPQVFLQTLPGADCCSTDEEYRIVGIDKDSDFLISSWYDTSDLKNNQMLIGAGSSLQVGMKMFILGCTFDVVGQLPQTGSSIDESIFIPLKQSRIIGKQRFSQDDYHYFEKNQDISNLVTCYLIQLRDNADPEKFIKAAENAGLDAQIIAGSSVHTKLKQHMNSLIKLFAIFSCIIIFTSCLGLYAFFSSNFGSRNREVGYLRSLGLTKADIFRLTLTEVAFSAGVGGIIGAAIGTLSLRPLLSLLQTLIVIPFGAADITETIAAILGGIFAALIVSCIAAIIPALKNAALDPATAITEEEN